MKCITFMLYIVIAFSTTARGNRDEKINEGASTSKQSNDELSDEEKLEIEGYFEQFIRFFVTDNRFGVTGYHDYLHIRHQGQSSQRDISGIDTYVNFEKKVNNLLKYGQDDAIQKNTPKLSNHKARKQYYKSIYKKFFKPYKLNLTYYCNDFNLYWHYTIRKTTVTAISTTAVSTNTEATTRTSSTAKPEKKSRFKRLYESCRMN